MFLAIVVGFYLMQITDTRNVRAGCERGNVQRELLASNTQRDAETRLEAVPGLGASGAQVAVRGVEGLAELQTLVNEYASVAVEPGSVQQDCVEAYPYPWPFGVG